MAQVHPMIIIPCRPVSSLLATQHLPQAFNFIAYLPMLCTKSSSHWHLLLITKPICQTIWYLVGHFKMHKEISPGKNWTALEFCLCFSICAALSLWVIQSQQFKMFLILSILQVFSSQIPIRDLQHSPELTRHEVPPLFASQLSHQAFCSVAPIPSQARPFLPSISHNPITVIFSSSRWYLPWAAAQTPRSNTACAVILLLSRSVVSSSLWPRGLQHSRLPCSWSPRACSDLCPKSQWCHPTISSSATTFSFCLQPFPASGSFPMGQLFRSHGQSTGVSASLSVLPMNIQGWFLLGLTGLISLLSKGLLEWFFPDRRLTGFKKDWHFSLHHESLHLVPVSLFSYLLHFRALARPSLNCMTEQTQVQAHLPIPPPLASTLKPKCLLLLPIFQSYVLALTAVNWAIFVFNVKSFSGGGNHRNSTTLITSWVWILQEQPRVFWLLGLFLSHQASSGQRGWRLWGSQLWGRKVLPAVVLWAW